MSKVSVVLPCYKVEKFLPLCLKSLSNQTLADFEVICVDDGSPDNCGKILDDYAAEDKRFKVIHQQNGGISAARNAALPFISSPYAMFVDSDDALHPQALELAVKAIKEHNADIVWFDAFCFGADNELNGLPHYNGTTKTVPCLTPPLEFYLVKPLWRRDKSEKMTGMVWNKIYRSDLIKGMSFEPGLCISEDNLFTLGVLPKVKTAVHLKALLYCYRRNPDSIMQTLNDEKVAKNLPMEMNGYIKLQKRIETENLAEDKKKLIKKHIASFFFKQFFRPYLKQKRKWIEQSYVDSLLYNSELDFGNLNIRYRIPLFLYQKGWGKLARLFAI